MAHTYLPDFIIAKKRKRSRLQAIDPCLGFYPAPSSSPKDTSQPSSLPTCPDPLSTTMISSYAEEMAHTSSQNRTHRALEQLDLVDDVHHPVIDRTQATANVVNLAGAPDPKHVPRGFETTLTVEGFLRSAATVATKRYSYRGSRRNVTREKEQVGWTSDEEEYVPEKPARKRQRRKKKTQSLSTRPLAAAVVTRVDVVGGLFFPDPPKAHISTVRPLPMSPGGRTLSPVDVAKSRRRQFVDPQKVDRGAVSQFARIAEDASVKKVKQRRPITAWEPKDHVVLGLRSGSSFGKDAFGPVEHFATRPLTLVSSTHPHSAYRARCTTIISRSGLVPNRRKNETQRRELGLPLESSRPRSILANPPTAPNGPHMQQGNYFSAPNSSRLASPAPSVPIASLMLLERDSGERCDPRAEVGDTLSSDANVLPVSVAVPPSHAPPLLIPNPHLDEVLPSCGSERPPSPHDSQIAFKPPRPAAPKPLKSLGSLLDGFREIARNATQMAAASQARRSMRLRPDTASKENGDPIRSAYRSARSRPSTAQPWPAARSVPSQIGRAQVDVSPKSFFAQDSPESGGVGADHPAFPRDSNSCGASAGDSTDAPPRTDRIDVAAVLRSYKGKAILLPSSPLPGWNALPCSSMGAENSEDDNNLY